MYRHLSRILGGIVMHNTLKPGIAESCTHELHFASLHAPGRKIAIPCGKTVLVDICAVTGRMRDTYFGARVMVGRDHTCPTVQVAQ